MPAPPNDLRPAVLPRPIDVPLARLCRHLGLPPDEASSEDVQARIDRARDWIADHASPWQASRVVAVESIESDGVVLSGGERWTSPLLARGFSNAEVESVIVFAATIGGEVDERVRHDWEVDRPDDAMFLSACAIAFLEHVRDAVADHLAGWAKTRQRRLLPRYSPGYDGWDLADQASLFRLIQETTEFESCQVPPVTLLDSCGLSPANSTITVYGLSANLQLPDRQRGFWQGLDQGTAAHFESPPDPMDDSGIPVYAFPDKALRKWADQRLTIRPEPRERFVATFRMDGSSCTNMGIPHTFQLTIEFRGNPRHGYQIEACRCRPAAGDRGHQATCGFLDLNEAFLRDVSEFKYPVGKRLDDLLQWSPEVNHAGCLCTEPHQNHKWLLALHTLHFALNEGTKR